MTAKVPSPKKMLTPIREAPAAPAKPAWGTAWATKAEPRRTVKNPTTPATTATIVATIQALAMNPVNITRLPAQAARTAVCDRPRRPGPCGSWPRP